MKKFTFILLAFIISGSAFAQNPAVSTQANASADIVSPITIDQVADLNFGKIIPSSTQATTIILGQDGAVDATSTGNSINTSNQNAAEFTINATNTYTFSVNIPAEITLTGTGDDMLVTLDPSLPAANNTSEGDPITLLVGGTLDVGLNQLEGNYTSTFDVSVAYE
ncbi:MAG: DUF4402 domain-containing protein [Bacteroidota bacterium]